MEFDERGYLVVDGVYTDPQFTSGNVVKIGGDYYRVTATKIMDSGEELAKHLIPMPAYQPPVSLEPVIEAVAAICMKCAFRELPEARWKVGRAITDDELREFMSNNGINDISRPFTEVKNAIYGKKYETTITMRQVHVELERSIALENELRQRGIYAYSGAPKCLNIRVE